MSVVRSPLLFLLLLTPYSSPPSCVGGIRRAIAVPNAGGWERLFLGDPSPAAFGGTGARPSVLRTSGVGAAQRASHVWDGCRPGSLLLSVLYAVSRTPLGCPPRGRLAVHSSRVSSRDASCAPTCILSCARKACTMPSCVSVSTSGVSPAHFVCTGGVLGLASSALVCWFVHSVRAECPFRS